MMTVDLGSLPFGPMCGRAESGLASTDRVRPVGDATAIDG